MNNPTTPDAKALAQKHRSLGALILSFAEGRYALASYGHTRSTCDAMRQIVEQIGDMIAAGDIEVPEVLGEAARGSVESSGAEDVNAKLLMACKTAKEWLEHAIKMNGPLAGDVSIFGMLEDAITKAQ